MNIKMKKKFPIGTRVVVNARMYKGGATVVSYDCTNGDFIGIETDTRNLFDHDCEGAALKGDGFGLWEYPEYLTVEYIPVSASSAKLKVGDRVMIDSWLHKGKATVVQAPNTTQSCYGFSTDDHTQYNHDCDGLTIKGHGLWLTSETVYKSAALIPTPKKPKAFKPGSQNGMLLTHLLEGLTITRIQADHLYRIASLTRRIKDLREAGHKIKAKVKIDPTGRSYTEYMLRSAGRV